MTFCLCNMLPCRDCGSHSFPTAADGHLPEVPSALLQDSIQGRWVHTYVCVYECVQWVSRKWRIPHVLMSEHLYVCICSRLPRRCCNQPFPVLLVSLAEICTYVLHMYYNVHDLYDHLLNLFNSYSVPLWYCVLCTIWWILEATKQGSVKNIIAFGDRFAIGR